MYVKPDRKSKRISLVELPKIPHSFLVTSKDIETRTGHKIKRKPKHKPKERGTTEVPVQNLPNLQTLPKLRWSFSNFPTINLRGISDDRKPPRPRPLWSREETFDADFMMPNRVREVLESEGLEHQVINTALRPLEEKHRKALRRMTEDQMSRDYIHARSMDTGRPTHLPPIVTTHKKSAYYPAFLQLGTMEPEEEYSGAMWKNPFDDDKVFDSDIDDTQLEADQRKWKEDQHAEQLFFGKTFQPPRVVLVSSKITKCHLLPQVYNENVISIVYDFETWTFTDIIDAIRKKLETYRKHCKARSIMVLCQGGPGHIYLLRNFVITPQKLHKSAYRVVVDFWQSLASLVSRITPSSAAIHMFGFRLCDNEQGKKLLPMLQSLMYPHLVRVIVVNEESDEGKEIIESYFKLNRYKIWKFHQNTSVTELDFKEGVGGSSPNPRIHRMSIS